MILMSDVEQDWIFFLFARVTCQQPVSVLTSTKTLINVEDRSARVIKQMNYGCSL